jgi:IS5 family transposase
MRLAYRLGQHAFRDHPNKFGRKGFTVPQLFACRVVREMLRLSYRKTEQLLRDTPQWLAQIGLSKAPDHNTLWRTFTLLCTTRRLNRMLDLLGQLFDAQHRLKLRDKPLAMDSTCYQQRHRWRHYDRRCRRMGLAPGAKFAGKTRL